MPKSWKGFAPQWKYAVTKTKTASKLYENECDIKMEYMSATGISNAHSMTKILSYYLFDTQKDIDNDRLMEDIIAKPVKAYDPAIFTLTQFTQGGFDKVELFGIVWYLWGGLGGSFYAFSPKYKCVFAYTVVGYNRSDVGLDKDYTKMQILGQEPRARVLFYYLAQYLKSL